MLYYCQIHRLSVLNKKLMKLSLGMGFDSSTGAGAARASLSIKPVKKTESKRGKPKACLGVFFSVFILSHLKGIQPLVLNPLYSLLDCIQI